MPKPMPAFGDTTLARAGDVSDHRIGIDIDDAGADRNLERHVLPFRSTLLGPSGLPCRHDTSADSGNDQCVERPSPSIKIEPPAAIATVRSPGNVFFAAEAEATVATLTCFTRITASSTNFMTCHHKKSPA